MQGGCFAPELTPDSFPGILISAELPGNRGRTGPACWAGIEPA